MTDDDGVSTEIPVDDETRAALLLFNERLEETAAADRAAKRIAKAERAKDEAAATVRKVQGSNASAEEKAEAEEAYKAAVAEFNRISENPNADDRPKPAASNNDAAATEVADEPSATPAEEAPAAEAPAEEPSAEAPAEEAAAPTEVSADEEPAAEAETTASESE